MRLAQVSHQLIGNQLTEPVFTEHGSMLLQKGTVVNNAIIEKLLSHNVNVVHVIDKTLKGIVHQPIIPKPQMAIAVQKVKDVFQDVLNQDHLGVKAVIPQEHFALVKEVVSMLLDIIEKSENILYSVVELIGIDSYTHRHNVNVAVLSILTAKAMGYKKHEMRDIALGALLHDIGKARINQEIIQKPSRLNDEERSLVEQHPVLGYKLIEHIESLPYLSKQIVYLHHEKLDGSGYPLGLKGIEIPEYVQIVTVCDMYDAMTTNRIYREKMPNYQALDILMAECIFKISAHILKKLVGTIQMFPPGTGVVLSDERVGIVASYKSYNPSRPRVRILNLDAIVHHLDVVEVDLEKHQTLFIVDVWDVETFRRGFSSKSVSMESEKKVL